MAYNELDKYLSKNNTIANLSINAGIEYESTHTSAGVFSQSRSVGYQLEALDGLGLHGELTLLSFYFGTDYMHDGIVNFEFETTTHLEGEHQQTVGYFIKDDDFEDVFSVDVLESSRGYGPIFITQSGVSSCPYEDGYFAQYITNPEQLSSAMNDTLAINSFSETSLELSAVTSRREAPTIDIYPYNLYNVPEQEQAVFNLTFGNESESGDDIAYMLRVDEASNPDGAIIKIDGLTPNRLFLVPAGGTVTKTVTIKKGPNALNYENLGLILHSSCQYDFGTGSVPDIADTVYFSAYFLPTCTDVTLQDLDDDWLVNQTDDNTLNIKLKDYDINYYSLEKIDIEYKFENDDWQLMQSLNSPRAIINEESYKYLDALALYNVLHSDFVLPEISESISSSDTIQIEQWYALLEPEEDCTGDDCKLVDFQGEGYTSTDLSDDESRHTDWYYWYANNSNDETCVSEENASISIDCYIERSLEDKKSYIVEEIERLKEEYLGEVPGSNPTTYYNADDLFLSMRNQSSTYSWDMPDLPNDGSYKIRAKSDCGTYTPLTGGNLEQVVVYSDIHDLYCDRLQPEVFGNISPIDGILNPDDEILLTFNEAINELDFNVNTAETFVEVVAKKNGTPHTHDSYLYFDGTDEMTIPAGVKLNAEFTIEMWIKPGVNEGVLFEQNYGVDADGIRISLVESSLLFEYIHPSDESKNKSVLQELVFSEYGFTHIAFSYNNENLCSFYYGDNFTHSVSFDYSGEGPIVIGSGYQGAIHDLRIWSSQRSDGDILANRSQSLAGTEANLIGYWPMDELKGYPQDKSRYRHANTDAQWTVDSENNSKIFTAAFDTTLLKDVSLGITETGDYTVETWFKSEDLSHQTLFSIGDWNLGLAQGAMSFDLNDGNIEVYISGDDSSVPAIASSEENYADNLWHHLALVKSDIGNTRLYIDGNEVAQSESEVFYGVSAIDLYLGARSPMVYSQNIEGSYLVSQDSDDQFEMNMVDSTQTSYAYNSDSTSIVATTVSYEIDTTNSLNLIETTSITTISAAGDTVEGPTISVVDYTNTDTETVWAYAQETVISDYQNLYNGKLDEIRIWSLAKTSNQILTDANNALIGSEIGLEVYCHFDEDQLSISTVDVPLITNASIKTSVSFDDVSNGDQVFINITEDLSKIENTILNITVQNVEDLYGNTIEEPITWDVYVDKNQLIWEEQTIKQEKMFGESLVFETQIINQGGQVELFEIYNLPVWLSVSPSEGIIEPNSYTSIEFIVNDDLFIGDYSEDVLLIGNNEYAERLNIQLEVHATPPTYDLNPNDYLYTMNFVGTLTVDGIRSRDDKDILFAMVDNEVRGATELIYLEDYDAYYVFFSVYSNTESTEEISFHLWDASEGKLQTQVSINGESTIDYEDGAIIGSFDALTEFSASNMIRQEIPLNTGWNWLSFNLDALDDENSLDLLMSTTLENVDYSKIEIVKNQSAYAVSYDSSMLGSLTSFDVTEMFMLKMNAADESIVYEGKAIDPTTAPITINEGWNWIGYLGQRLLNVNEALSSLNPSSGDVIKSKTGFSMYANESLGWLGTLGSLESGSGYMLKHTDADVLIYPESSMLGGGSFRLNNNQLPVDKWTVDASKYEFSMNIVAHIDHSDYYDADIENVLGAFVGTDCVGNITATPIADHKSIYFITIYGNDEDIIEFDYYDVNKDKTYKAENVLAFEANNLVGSIDNPYSIIIDVEEQDLDLDFFAMNVYPNPFDDRFELGFSLEMDADVQVKIVDMLGRIVQEVSNSELEMGTHRLSIDAKDLERGAYFVEIQIDGKSCRTMVVKS